MKPKAPNKDEKKGKRLMAATVPQELAELLEETGERLGADAKAVENTEMGIDDEDSSDDELPAAPPAPDPRIVSAIEALEAAGQSEDAQKLRDKHAIGKKPEAKAE
eukprot:13968643-Alexandrium_andersonii.AAC.1